MFGAFVFVPGIGHVAAGGYLLFMLIAAGLGATGGALGGALTSTGIPKDGIPVYESDLPAELYLVIAHGTPATSTTPGPCSPRPPTSAWTTTRPRAGRPVPRAADP